MANLSDYIEAAWLNHTFRTTAYTQPTNVHVALFTAAPSDSGGGTEVSGGSYARVSVARADAQWNAPGVAGLIDNVNAITFATATASWGTATHVGIFDAATSGNLLYQGALRGAAKTVSGAAAGDTLTSTAHGYANGTTIVLEVVPGLSLPGGLTAGTVYYVVATAANTFQLSATLGGTAIDITTDGTASAAQDNRKTVGNGDTFSFAAGALDISLA